MKEVSPPNPEDGTSPADSNESTDAAAAGGRVDGGVAVTSNRPTPSPPFTAASASSNAGAETTKDDSKATVEIIAKNPSKKVESKNVDGNRVSACLTAATPLPSLTFTTITKKNFATASTSMKQSPLEGTAISHQAMKFTPIRSAYSMAPHSISRGYGNSTLATPGPVTSGSMDTIPLLESSAGSAAMMHGGGHDDCSITRGVGIGMTPLPPLDETNFENDYADNQDEYALPPFFQSHLDETFAASSSPNALFIPSILSSSTGNNHEADSMLQFASYVPNVLNEAANAEYQLSAYAGVAPPDPTGRRVAVNNGNVYTGSMAPLVRENVITAPAIPSKTSFFDATNSTTKIRISATRGPQLPLRKRPLREEDEGKEVSTRQFKQERNAVKKSTRPKGPSTKKPSVKKAKMVRHNYNENRTSCKCAKSRCLKLYCDCFQSGRMCDPNECECKSCLNLEKYNGRNGARTKAIKECLAKNPNAFMKRQKGSDEGCGCKKNRCLKKYCVCFNAGVLCNESCRCENCGNREVGEEMFVGNNEVAEDPVLKVKACSEDVAEEPPTKFVKVTSLSDDADNTSPITESSDSSDSLAHSSSQRHENAYQAHNIIQGDFVCGYDQIAFESYAEV